MLHQGLPRKHHHYRQRDYSFEGTCGGSFLRSTCETIPRVQSERAIGGFHAFRLKANFGGEYSRGACKSGALPTSERTESGGKHLPGHFDDRTLPPTSLDFSAS